MKTCGIYKITNKENGKIYVGSSKDIFKRWEQHKKDLEGKRHHNAKLQNAWNKEENIDLEYSVLEECGQDVLLEREQYWIDTLDSYSNGYNCSEKAAYPTEKIKSSIKVKYEKEFNQICENLETFKELENKFPKDILVSFFGLGVGKASSDTAFIKRFLKAVDLCVNIILDESEIVEQDVEYRLHHIHYTNKVAEYELTPEHNQGKNSKYSIHNAKKKPDLHCQLWNDLFKSLDQGGRIGKEIKKRYSEYLENNKNPLN